jgi:uncharacterized protein
MIILYTSDLHGEIDLYNQVFERSRESSAAIVALGGDLLPRLRQAGAYGEMAAEQRSFARDHLVPLWKTWLKKGPVRRILVIPGNWDMAYPELFAKPVEGIVNLDRRKFACGGCEWIGYSFVSPSLLRPKDYEKVDDPDDPLPAQKSPSYLYSSNLDPPIKPIDPYIYLRAAGTIRDDLARLPAPDDVRKTIYLMHSPPWGTKLDVIRGGVSVGSRSIRRFIKERRPLMTLHGHIHEAPEVSGAYFQRLGETLSVNPGQSLPSRGGRGELQAVIFDTDDPVGTLRHTCRA